MGINNTIADKIVEAANTGKEATFLDSSTLREFTPSGLKSYIEANNTALNGLTATAAEINNAADVSARVLELVASGAVATGIQSVELNHASVVIAATMVATEHPGLFIVKDTSATGTTAHTLTLTGGTFNGTATIATLNARDEMLVVYFDSAGRGQVIANIGAVALS